MNPVSCMPTQCTVDNNNSLLVSHTLSASATAPRNGAETTTIIASLLVRGRPPRPPHRLHQAAGGGYPYGWLRAWQGWYVCSQQSTESCGEPRGHSSILPSVFTDRAPESREVLLWFRIEPATFRPQVDHHYHCATCLTSRRTGFVSSEGRVADCFPQCVESQ